MRLRSLTMLLLLAVSAIYDMVTRSDYMLHTVYCHRSGFYVFDIVRRRSRPTFSWAASLRPRKARSCPALRCAVLMLLLLLAIYGPRDLSNVQNGHIVKMDVGDPAPESGLSEYSWVQISWTRAANVIRSKDIIMNRAAAEICVCFTRLEGLRLLVTEL
jgi:hypothetical protein